jgi:hypothetical protein
MMMLKIRQKSIKLLLDFYLKFGLLQEIHLPSSWKQTNLEMSCLFDKLAVHIFNLSGLCTFLT